MNGRLDVTTLDGGEGEALEAARPGGGPGLDARLLVRETARAPPERQTRRGRRGHCEEAAAAPDAAARGEPRQARHAGPPGALAGPGGSRARSARAQVGRPGAAAGARPAGAGARGPAGEAHPERAPAL